MVPVTLDVVPRRNGSERKVVVVCGVTACEKISSLGPQELEGYRPHANNPVEAKSSYHHAQCSSIRNENWTRNLLDPCSSQQLSHRQRQQVVALIQSHHLAASLVQHLEEPSGRLADLRYPSMPTGNPYC